MNKRIVALRERGAEQEEDARRTVRALRAAANRAARKMNAAVAAGESEAVGRLGREYEAALGAAGRLSGKVRRPSGGRPWRDKTREVENCFLRK